MSQNIKIEDKKSEKISILNDALSYMNHLCFDFSKNYAIYKLDLGALKQRLDVIEEASKGVNKIVSEIKLLESMQ